MTSRYTAEMNQDEYSYVTRIIRENTYLDDIIFSVADVLEAHVVTSDIETVLSTGNFHI